MTSLPAVIGLVGVPAGGVPKSEVRVPAAVVVERGAPSGVPNRVILYGAAFAITVRVGSCCRGQVSEKETAVLDPVCMCATNAAVAPSLHKRCVIPRWERQASAYSYFSC